VPAASPETVSNFTLEKRLLKAVGEVQWVDNPKSLHMKASPKSGKNHFAMPVAGTGAAIFTCIAAKRLSKRICAASGHQS